jgi:transcription termination factor Rho
VPPAGRGRSAAGDHGDSVTQEPAREDRAPAEQQAQGDQGQGDQPAEGEGGRRRRRRRGRDRDRNDEGAEPTQNWEGELIEVAGILDLRDEGYGFLRVNGLLPSRDDVYVSVKQTRQFGLRRGDWVTGASRPAHRGEKNPALLRIDTVNGTDPERSRERPVFEELTPLFPQERLRLEREDHPYDIAGRVIDLLAPIGKGQRGLIVSPPKAGKTTIMKTLAQCIEANHPEVELMVLLVDERPEEVTDMRRSIEGEVVASTFDRPAEEHIQVAELAIERAKRMVEQGQDVVVILDGITRLARAYNLAAPNGGRIMSGGLDTSALYPPKRFFGAARNLEEGGSLTILATALVETGSKMDEVIFEEFKGTGNMELRLDRRAAEQRVFPAIDVDGSSTRHDELLIDAKELAQIQKLRRLLSKLAAEGDPAAGLELVIDRMRKFPTNEVFLAEIAKAPAIS